MRVPENAVIKGEITRKEFLRYMLGIILVIVGVNNFISAIRNFILQQNNHSGAIPSETRHGFGASKFGK